MGQLEIRPPVLPNGSILRKLTFGLCGVNGSRDKHRFAQGGEFLIEGHLHPGSAVSQVEVIGSIALAVAAATISLDRVPSQAGEQLATGSEPTTVLCFEARGLIFS